MCATHEHTSGMHPDIFKGSSKWECFIRVVWAQLTALLEYFNLHEEFFYVYSHMSNSVSLQLPTPYPSIYICIFTAKHKIYKPQNGDLWLFLLQAKILGFLEPRETPMNSKYAPVPIIGSHNNEWWTRKSRQSLVHLILWSLHSTKMVRLYIHR